MKPLAFNIKDAKKIKTDGKTSTFDLGKGHCLTILHSALPALQRKMIEKMPIEKLADGGELEAPDTRRIPQAAKDDEAKTRNRDADETEQYGRPLRQRVQPDPSGTTTMKQGQTMSLAQGGQVPRKMYADSQEPVSADDSAPTQNPVQIDINAQPQAQQPAPPQGVQPIPGEEQQINPAATMANSDQMAGVQKPQIPAAVPNLNPDGTMNPAAVAKNSQAAIEAQNQIEQAQGQAAANRIAGYNKGMAQVNQDIQNKTQFLATHVNQFANYINSNPIDPNHYIDSMSSGKKITTAIGLFLGGLGGGLNHTGNASLDYLKMQIQNDITAQKDRADQQKTIYGAYKELYGAGIAADNSTKASLLDIYNQQVQQAAAQLGTPIAQQRALQFGAAMAIEKSKLVQDAAVSLPTLPGTKSVGGGGPAGVQRNPQMPGKPSAINSPAPADRSIESIRQDDHILAPGAREKLLSARYGSKNEYAKDYDQVAHQAEAAALTDKAIDAINVHFPKMFANVKSNYFEPSKEDSVGGKLERAVAPIANFIPDAGSYVHKKGENFEDVPYVGKAIAGVAKLGTDTQSNRSYDVDREAMLAAMTSALTHSGMAPTEAHSAAMAYLPVEGDTLEMAKKKISAAKEKLRNVTKTDALEAHNLIQKNKK